MEVQAYVKSILLPRRLDPVEIHHSGSFPFKIQVRPNASGGDGYRRAARALRSKELATFSDRATTEAQEPRPRNLASHTGKAEWSIRRGGVGGRAARNDGAVQRNAN